MVYEYNARFLDGKNKLRSYVLDYWYLHSRLSISLNVAKFSGVDVLNPPNGWDVPSFFCLQCNVV